MTRRCTRSALLGIVLALAATGLLTVPGHADVLHLKGGRQLVGRIQENGSEVSIELSYGTLNVPRDRVARIERAELPADEVRREAAELKAEDLDGALRVAAQASSHGLTDLAGSLLEAASERAPERADLAAAWRTHRLFEREPAREPEAEETLLADFRAASGEVRRAELYLTRHWRIAHDVSLAEVRERGDMLEAAWRKFHELADRLDLPTAPIDGRLEVMLFSQHAHWVKALGVPAAQLDGLNGMFVGRTGRILIFDTRTAPVAIRAAKTVRAERTALAATRAEVDAQAARIDGMETKLNELSMTQSDEERARRADVRSWIVEARAGIERARKRLNASAADVDAYERRMSQYHGVESLATATHEACHQLSYRTGVARPGQSLWLTEGLATLFEVRGRSHFVLEATNEGRLLDIRRGWAEDSGRDVRRVLTGADFHSRDSKALAYAESWALTHFLVMRHPETFGRYIREAEPSGAGPGGAAPRLAEFTRFFGSDLDALQRDWVSYVERL